MCELKNKVLDNFHNYFYKIKIIENEIKHDVKSIEYFLAEELENAGFKKYINLFYILVLLHKM